LSCTTERTFAPEDSGMKKVGAGGWTEPGKVLQEMSFSTVEQVQQNR